MNFFDFIVLAGSFIHEPVPDPASSVPSWVFYWVIVLTLSLGAVLLTVIKILWDKADKVSGLSEKERHALFQLYEWHNKVDSDQVPMWYTPRALVDLISSLQDDRNDIKVLLSKLVDQHDNVTSDLRQQLRERLESQDRLHHKMLQLAVRVQQAVEALAGLEPPTIDFDGDDEE